jgi:hypothetical protein
MNYKGFNTKGMFENKFHKLFFIKDYSLNLKGLFQNPISILFMQISQLAKPINPF